MDTTCILCCSLEFFPLWMSRKASWSCILAGFTPLAFSCHHLEVWNCPVVL